MHFEQSAREEELRYITKDSVTESIQSRERIVAITWADERIINWLFLWYQSLAEVQINQLLISIKSVSISL
jgi:hypothetical protein